MLLKRILLTTERLPFNRNFIDKSIPERFKFVLNNNHRSIAINDMGEVFTYQELDLRTNCLANEIIKINNNLFGDQEHAVALVLGHNVHMIVGMLGTLKAGCFFTTIDTNLPKSRISYLLEDSRANVIITSESYLETIMNLDYEIDRVINLDEINWDLNNHPVNHRVKNEHIGNLIYTSGSTGRPKGVIRTHSNILHYSWWSGDAYSVCPDDRLSLISSLSHGGAINSVFRALLNGCKLYLFDLKNLGLVELINWLQENKITLFRSTPTILRQISLLLPPINHFESIRILVVGGETIRKTDIGIFNEYFSENTTMCLGGGTTEASVFAVCFIRKGYQISNLGVPMGFVIPDTEVLIWDENENQLPIGELGEIIVKSKFLSKGYWMQSELTHQHFLSDPEDRNVNIYKTGDLGFLTSDGVLYHKGRQDHQVKIRGFRVEVGEIESVLLENNCVSEAVVIGRTDHDGELILVAYVKPSNEESEAIRVSNLRGFLKERLPDFMVPTFFIILNALPMTTSGKIDYCNLPEVEFGRPDLDIPYVAPRNLTEKKLERIWSEILGFVAVGVYDDLLELGGNSLNITQIKNRIELEFQVNLSISHLFDITTIKELAEIIMSKEK